MTRIVAAIVAVATAFVAAGVDSLTSDPSPRIVDDASQSDPSDARAAVRRLIATEARNPRVSPTTRWLMSLRVVSPTWPARSRRSAHPEVDGPHSHRRPGTSTTLPAPLLPQTRCRAGIHTGLVWPTLHRGRLVPGRTLTLRGVRWVARLAH